ncbi:MFS transporter [Streptomyces spinoverrucosus]|uniref:MFS transporter n=1 Tax=Streptomyces spinoverrucosus TaxID=284043 RepID=A0A4Y3VA42_9ACTN|nr:MFS transporter [Streptomyces spinoverrucosus]GEC03243.1 MFS transporter [Streptomyces spinoverrucosus]GHB37165.1 MFS transporter [Streptomyces spinoverrucosus]
MPRSVLSLAISTFAIGTTEFVIVGIIPSIADDLQVGVPTAGLLVSLYALSITIGAPLFTALTGRIDRRKLVIWLMAVFLVGNLAAGFAPGFATLLAARVVTAFAHAVFFSVGATVAASLVPREKANGAVAVMFGGLTVAMVLGVPLGSWIGGTFDWRFPFLVVTALAAVSVVSLMLLLPKNISHTPPQSLISQLRLLRNGRLVTMYLITALGFGANFVVFTYISPLLTSVTGVRESMVNVGLVVFGIATVIGNFWGGRLADRLGTRQAVIVVLVGLAATLALLPVTAHSVIAVMINLAVWGFFGFAINPVVQTGVVTVAEDEVPESVGAASGFNIAAFNLGISGGSLIGGRVLDSAGVLTTPWAAIALAVAATAVTGLALRPRSVHPAPVETLTR